MNHLYKGRMTALAQAVVLSVASSVFAGLAVAATDSDVALEYASVHDLSARMARNELSSVELVKHLQARIASLDEQGPTLNAVIELKPGERHIRILIHQMHHAVPDFTNQDTAICEVVRCTSQNTTRQFQAICTRS